MQSSYHEGQGGQRLLADIGGTNARFALEAGPGDIGGLRTLACADFPRFEDAVHTYLEVAGKRVRHAVIAIANPVDGDAIKMTNHHWAFSIEAARRELGLDTLLVVNDFTAPAPAWACPAWCRRKGAGRRCTAKAATWPSRRWTNASSRCCAIAGGATTTSRPSASCPAPAWP